MTLLAVRPHALGVLLAVTVVLAGCGADPDDAAGPAESTTTTAAECAAEDEVRTVRYARDEGVAPDLQSLDVYPVERCEPRPALIWVHGGGWRRGDKGGRDTEQKAAWAAEQGWVLVAVNYRLSAPGSDVRWPAHGEDVAAAVAWVLEHADEIGVDPRHVALLGHSAGGHLVAIVAADPDLLGDTGHARTDVDCVATLDGGGYDLVAPRPSRRNEMLIRNAFGPDPAVRQAASPVPVLDEEGGPLADTLVVTRGTTARQEVARRYAEAVEAAGGDSEVLVAGDLSHGEVNATVGRAGDEVVTPALETFLDGCLSGS